MEDNLIEILETFNLPVIRQGSLAPDEAYPDTFFTFWNNSEEGQSYYDNDVALTVEDFSVNVYSTDPDTVYDLLKEARQKLKANGWTIFRRGYDIASDEITHVGRGMEVMILTNENN